MYQTYKPSGKVSWMFFPLLLLFFLLVIPSVSFLYVYVIWHSPSVIVNGFLYLLALYLLALYGCRVCVRIGKARNLKLAGLSGVLTGAFLLYMMLACYFLFSTGDASPARLFELALRPGSLLEAVNGLVQEGLTIATVKGRLHFTLKGGFLISAMVVLLLLTAGVLAGAYVDTAWFPFCEASKRWMASRTIYMEYIEDKDLFVKKLAFGDTSPLMQVEVLKDINCSHSEATLYMADQSSVFYLTMENKKKTEGKKKSDDEVLFEAEELVEQIRLPAETGRILLSKAYSSPEQASAKVVTEESGKKKALTLVRMMAATGIQIGLLAVYFLDLDSMREFFSSGVALFYMVINLFVFSMGLLGCFIKEDVMFKKEEQLFFNETKRYQMERWDSPVSHKIYYGVMTLTSLALLILCLRRNLP